MLSWMPPEPEHQNGVITKYHLIVEAIEFFSSFHLIFPNTTGVVRNLKPYSTYQVRISASTVAGVGPQSDVLTFQTLEDGRSHYGHITHSIFFAMYYLFQLQAAHHRMW